MRRKKTIITEAIFCDHCGKEIDNDTIYNVVHSEDSLQYEFCNEDCHKKWIENKQETNK